MAFSKSYARGLQKCVANMWKGGDTSDCDFTVVVENTSFKCHRLLLSACSGLFRGLFNSNMMEQLESRVYLVAITASTFDTIINALYTGKKGLSDDNLLDVWSATEMLQIEYIKEGCQKFAMENISVDNCCGILDQATLFDAQNVIDHSLDFIVRHFKNVREQDNLLQLSFDNFYKVIAHDSLATDCEEVVVDAVLDWVKYTPRSAQSTLLHSETLDAKAADEILPEHCENRVEHKSNIMTSGGNKTMYNKNSTHQTESKEADRKQHFLKLISACRLFLAQPTCLENLLENHIDLLISTGAYNMVLGALKYSLSVALRHEAWPKVAVHRASSSYKHVMVFLSGNQFKAYSLDTGSVHDFAKAPRGYRHGYQITVFDNCLYLFYHTIDRHNIFSMITKQKSWVPVIGLNTYSKTLIAHGNYVYNVHAKENQFTLSRWSYAHGHSTWMTHTCNSPVYTSIIRFQLYVVVLITTKDVVTAYCFNTETDNVHICTTSMLAIAYSKITFSNNEDVYVLEGNGSLWKVFSTDKTPVDFVLVSKLFDFNCQLRGCVLFRNKLYIFYSDFHGENPNTLLTSLPGICEDIVMIKINSFTQCLPMVLPGSWLTS